MSPMEWKCFFLLSLCFIVHNYSTNKNVCHISLPLPNFQKVSSREIRSRTIADLGTKPEFRYEPSFAAKRKRDEEAAAAAAAEAAHANGSVGGGSSSGGHDQCGGGSGTGVCRRGGGSIGGGSANINGGDDSHGKGLSGGTGAGGAGGGGSALKVAQSRKKKFKKERGNKNKEEERMIKEWVDQLPGADLSGYFPLRGDFEFEHDNTAEEVGFIFNLRYKFFS